MSPSIEFIQIVETEYFRYDLFEVHTDIKTDYYYIQKTGIFISKVLYPLTPQGIINTHLEHTESIDKVLEEISLYERSQLRIKTLTNLTTPQRISAMTYSELTQSCTLLSHRSGGYYEIALMATGKPNQKAEICIFRFNGKYYLFKAFHKDYQKEVEKIIDK